VLSVPAAGVWVNSRLSTAVGSPTLSLRWCYNRINSWREDNCPRPLLSERAMKQVVQNIKTGETRVMDVPVPLPAPGTALVKTAASLVSVGTERSLVAFAGKSMLGKARSRPDLVRQVLDKARREGILSTISSVQGRLDQLMPLGYSSAGIIVEVGDHLQGFHIGDRVACAGGGYAIHAEYNLVPANLMALLPETVALEDGAFVTLGAIALHGFRLAEPQLGESVAVIGLGLLGLLAGQIAMAAGCRVFGVDLSKERIELARTLGIEAVHRSEAVPAGSAFTHNHGFDVVLICADTASNDTVTLAGEIGADRGRVIATGVVGTGLPRKLYYEKELSFRVSRSYGPGRYDPLYEEAGQDYPRGYVRWTEGRNLEAIVGLLDTKRLRVEPLISHRFPIQAAAEAYEMITAGEQSFLGVLLEYDEDEDQKDIERTITLKAAVRQKDGQVNLGALGAGNFATATLFPAIRRIKTIHPIGLATRSGMKSSNAGERFGFRYATTDEREILRDEEINTIAVLTRHDLHASQVIAALQADKHVFCEKPLALNRQELSMIEEALMESGRLLLVGFNRRFAPLAVELKSFFADSREPMAVHYRVNAGHLPDNHWLHDLVQGGGRIIGEGCHFIDFLTYIIGETPLTVRADGLPDQGRYHEDNVVFTLRYPDGSIGTVSYLANGDKSLSKERVEVFCGGKVGILDDFRRLELISNGRSVRKRAWLRQDKGHQAEWAAFSEAILHGGEPPIPYIELFAVTEAAFSTVAALRSGTAVTIGRKR